MDFNKLKLSAWYAFKNFMVLLGTALLVLGLGIMIAVSFQASPIGTVIGALVLIFMVMTMSRYCHES